MRKPKSNNILPRRNNCTDEIVLTVLPVATANDTKCVAVEGKQSQIFLEIPRIAQNIVGTYQKYF